MCLENIHPWPRELLETKVGGDLFKSSKKASVLLIVVNNVKLWDWHEHTALFKIVNQQGPTV